MQSLSQALWLSLATGLAGTGMGCLAAMLLPPLGAKLMSGLMHLTGGLMLAVVCFELLPEAILISQSTAVWGVLAGAALMLWTDRIAPRSTQENSARRTGLLLCLGVAMHNLPEGLAVGAGYQDAPVLGLALALCIIAHDVPEGLAMALPLKRSGMHPWRVLGLGILSGLPTVLGTWLGWLVGGSTPRALAFCLALAAGAMLQIICQHLLPQAREESAAPAATLCLSIGVLGGALLTHWI